MKKILILLVAFLLSNQAWALREYYALSRSPRALGMGGAFYGLSDDEYALFYNPAGLALYRGNGQLMLGVLANSGSKTLSAINTVSSLKNSNAGAIIDALNEYQGTPIYANAGIMLPYYLRKNLAIGLLITDVKMQLAILGKDFDTSLDVTAISDSGLFIGYGRNVWDGLSVGATLKGVLRAGGKKQFSILDIAQGSNFNLDPQSLGGVGAGIDFDLGANYEFTGIPYTLVNHVGLSFNNMLASQLTMFRNGTPPTLQRMMSLGLHSVFPGVGWIDNFHVLVDFAEFGLGGESDPDYGSRGESFWKHVNLGTEIPMGGWFIVRAGVHQGYFTAGIGLSSPVVKLDLTTYEEDLGYSVNRLSSRRFMLRLAIGGGSSSGNTITGPYVQTKKVSETEPSEAPTETKTPDAGPVNDLKVEPIRPAVPVPVTPEVKEKDKATHPDSQKGKEAVPSTGAQVVKPENKTTAKPAAPKVETAKPNPDVDRFDVDRVKNAKPNLDSLN